MIENQLIIVNFIANSKYYKILLKILMKLKMKMKKLKKYLKKLIKISIRNKWIGVERNRIKYIRLKYNEH